MDKKIETILNAVSDGDDIEFEPRSKAEEYLKNCINEDGTEGLPEPITRMDALLYKLADNIADAESGGGNSGGGGGGAIPDWSQNDETAPDYIKNRTHWEETFEPIQINVNPEGRESFDASAMGFGVFYKISDKIWTEEHLQSARHYARITDVSEPYLAPFKAEYQGIQINDEAIGFCVRYSISGDGAINEYVFVAKTAVDLTQVYGFSIPSAGTYACILGWNYNGDVLLQIEPILHTLDKKYLPKDLADDVMCNMFSWITHMDTTIPVEIDGDVTDFSMVFGESEEVDAQIDKVIFSGMAAFTIRFSTKSGNVDERHEVNMHLPRMDYPRDIRTGSTIVIKDNYELVRVNLRLSVTEHIFEVWATTVVDEPDIRTMIANEIGDIERTLDEIIALQEGYIGGTA